MEIMQKNREISEAFINTLISKTKAETCLYLAHSDLALFKELHVKNIDRFDWPQFPTKGAWDIVLGDFPFGMPLNKNLFPDSNAQHYGMAATAKALSYIKDDGYGIFSLEPFVLAHDSTRSIKNLLKNTNCSVAATISTPVEFLKPATNLTPVFVIIKKGFVTNQFVAELESAEQARIVADNFFKNINSNGLSNGIFLDGNTFNGFRKWKYQQQIKLLDSEYKKFTSTQLASIAIAINSCKTGASHVVQPNSIYIPKIGTQPVIDELEKATIKHQNYYQIVVKPDRADAAYLAAFFNSKLGKLIMQALHTESFIPSINKSDIAQVDVALPKLSDQKEIASSIQKILLIKEKIIAFEADLAINPISSQHALTQIDSMLEVVGALADADKVKALIRSGESKTIEFKESLSLDIRNQAKEKRIEDSAIKTVAAFLNSDGGILLIGVRDADSSITGIEKEIELFHKNTDKFLLHFKNLIRDRIGEQFYPFIDQRLASVDDKTILFVDCKQSSSEVYVDGKDFYVRTNPATDKIEGPKLVAYIKAHSAFKT